MIKYIFPKILLFLFITICNSQTQKFSYLSIPKELKEDANAVVRFNNTTIDVLSTDNMVIKIDRAVTVLNKLGNSDVGAVVGYDDNSKITKLEAKVYDALGNEIKKINKKDFIDVSAVDGGTLYSDSRVQYLDYTPISYPYTIHFQYQKKHHQQVFYQIGDL